MARKENIESLDLLLRNLCLPDVPFGGKVVVDSNRNGNSNKRGGELLLLLV